MDQDSLSALRPFQKTLFITETIEEKLDWCQYELEDLFDFEKTSKRLGDDTYLELLELNRVGEFLYKSIFGSEKNDVFITDNSLLATWESQLRKAEYDETSDKFARLNKIKDQYLIKRNTLESGEVVSSPLVDKVSSSIQYHLRHDERVFFIVLKNKETNLLDDNLLKPLTREIVKTLGLYFHYNLVSKNPWFYHYLNQL